MRRISDDCDTAAYRELEKIAVHADILLSSDCKEAADISDYLLMYHNKHGDYQLAAEYGKQSLKIAEDLFEPENPEIAKRQSNLALVLKDFGEYEEAAQLLRMALESDKKNFEPGHPSIARSQWNLAGMLYHLKEYEEAQELLQQAYNSFLNKLGADHPHTKGAQSWLNAVIDARGSRQ